MIEQNETNGVRARPELLERGADSGQAWHLHVVMTSYGAVARHPREGSPAFTRGKDLKAVGRLPARPGAITALISQACERRQSRLEE